MSSFESSSALASPGKTALKMVIAFSVTFSAITSVLYLAGRVGNGPRRAVAAAPKLSEHSQRTALQMPEQMQQGPSQVRYLLQLLDERAHGRRNFLSFGVGHDSTWWHNQIKRRGGQAIFMENIESWIQEVKNKDGRLHIEAVQYHGTNLNDLERLASPSGAWCGLRMRQMPTSVRATKWDMVMVDSPRGMLAGCTPGPCEGRFQSIYEAAQLVKPGGYIVVDDCEREVEKRFGDAALGAENRIAITNRTTRGRVAVGNQQCIYRVPPRPKAMPAAAVSCVRPPA